MLSVYNAPNGPRLGAVADCVSLICYANIRFERIKQS